MAHRTVTVGPGKTYASLQAAFDGEYVIEPDVTAGTTDTVGTFPSVGLEFQVYAFADTATTTPAFTVDATHWVLVRVMPGERGLGIWDETKYYMNAASGWTLFASRYYWYWDGLQLKNGGTDLEAHAALRYDPYDDGSSATVVFTNSYFRADNAASAYVEYMVGAFNNCIFYGAWAWRNGGGPTTYFYNCDFIGTYYAWFTNYGDCVFLNCFGRSTVYTNPFTVSSGTHSYGTSLSTGPSIPPGLTQAFYTTDNFKSVTFGADDYLQVDPNGVLKDTGTDLSAEAFWFLGAVDIAGATRTNWDIGAFEDATAPGDSGVRAKEAAVRGFVTVMPPDAWAVNRPAAGTAYSLPTQLFPASNWWNIPVTTAPVDVNSASYIALCTFYPGIGALPGPRTDWGLAYGLPYCTVSGNYPTVHFDGGSYWAESDDVGYPIPKAALTEVGWTEDLFGTIDAPVSTGDRHLLIVDIDRQRLYEVYQPFHNATGEPVTRPETGAVVPPYGFWCASACYWDMTTNNTRPDGWTSSDAAGLQVLPGLVKYDEVMGSVPVTHAHRLTLFGNTSDPPLYVWPATHHAGSWNPGMPPLGARFRLKASYDISGEVPVSQRLLQSFKDYGLIFADNGGHGMVTGTNDSRWGTTDEYPRTAFIDAMSRLRWSDFEVITLGWTNEAQNAGAVTAGAPTVNAAGNIDYAAVAPICTVVILAGAATVVARGTVDNSAHETSTAEALANLAFALLP